jgi:hypothetical protein
MERALRISLPQPLATFARKPASGGKIRARPFAPGWRADKPLYRFRKTHLCGQSGVGHPILANTVGNAVASQVSGSQDTSQQAEQTPQVSVPAGYYDNDPGPTMDEAAAFYGGTVEDAGDVRVWNTTTQQWQDTGSGVGGVPTTGPFTVWNPDGSIHDGTEEERQAALQAEGFLPNAPAITLLNGAVTDSNNYFSDSIAGSSQDYMLGDGSVFHGTSSQFNLSMDDQRLAAMESNPLGTAWNGIARTIGLSSDAQEFAFNLGSVGDGAAIAEEEGIAAESGVPKGWSVGDDIYALTSKGNEPAWSTVRGRFWKNEAANPQVGTWNAENLDRMSQGLAPQRYNFDKGGLESMELSHEPIPFRDGGTNVVPRWPQDHAAVDPYRRPGY